MADKVKTQAGDAVPEAQPAQPTENRRAQLEAEIEKTGHITLAQAEELAALRSANKEV